jgi:hypothetical protein
MITPPERSGKSARKQVPGNQNCNWYHANTRPWKTSRVSRPSGLYCRLGARISVLAAPGFQAALVQVPTHFLVPAQGVAEPVLEVDDAARGLDGGALPDEFADAGRDAQLTAGVAAVTALRTQRGDQPGLADGPQEGPGGAEDGGGSV